MLYFSAHRMTKMIIVLIWIYAVLTLVPFIESLRVTPDRQCLNDLSWWPNYVAFQLTFVLSCLAPGCVLPLTCIALCYISIGISLSNRRLSVQRARHSMSQRTRQNRKTIKVLTSLVAVYTICIVPHYILLSMSVFDGVNTAKLPYIFELHEFTRLMMTANSCLNPIIYSVVSKEFRDRMRYICCRTRILARGDVNPAAGPFPAVRIHNLPPHQL